GEPHARGDGPPRCRWGRRRWWRAPRTWGWTAFNENQAPPREESPTHVGMDRSVACGVGGGSGEPHARGDGPTARPLPAQRGTRAPRTWGWTMGAPRRRWAGRGRAPRTW